MRRIIHCDCDSFYASVEMRDDPSLRDKPVAVGGSPDKRGVIATCNYPARAFGVRSAMSSRRALALCPSLVILFPDFPRYKAASQAVQAIFRRYTDLVEPLSLDEAFLDVTEAAGRHGSATKIAEEIRAAVRAEVGITISAGVAPNKFLAKVASDVNKPDGLFVVKPRDIDDFVAALPIERIFGVGRVTAAKMHRLGLYTCADVQRMTHEELAGHFGSYGERLWQLSRGIDERPVRNDYLRKSLSVENTWPVDVPDREACQQALRDLIEDLRKRYEKIEARYRIAGVDIKVRYTDFSIRSRQRACDHIDADLLATLLDAQLDVRPPPVRLLGAGLRLLPRDAVTPARKTSAQRDLFND